MSTPPPYRPSTAPHDEDLPPYHPPTAPHNEDLPSYRPPTAPHNEDLPSYRPPTARHDENLPPYRLPTASHDENLPSYRPPTAPSNEDLPLYTTPHRQLNTQEVQAPPGYQRLAPHLSSSQSTSTYRECRALLDPNAEASPLANNSRKSTWQRLKEENEARKARTVHVTHEQAAAMLGHDEEWHRERQGWATSRERWEEMIRENRMHAAEMLGSYEEWAREWERTMEMERNGRVRDDRWACRTC
ncbi:hypothetical protein DE146DRAFT_454836 [Phaeosphaeria sp. MPI-PUGE-AT-0046c]|nr:hypothetical protein DE146DRAFT_454836 [Phaeosphaeria sp. MPI-PUGE-AT-0046c]